MNLFQIITDDIYNISQNLVLEKKIIKAESNFTVEFPKDKAHGDISTNIAMISCKANNLKPQDLAKIYLEKILKLSYIKTAEIAGAGFINITCNQKFWQQIIPSINKLKIDYGNSNIGNNIKVNLEYVSVNPTGPMHIGHARGAAYGDSLAILLEKAGFDVDKEYYINDAGKQIDILAHSTYLRYLEALGETIEIPIGYYPGEYLIPLGQTLYNKYNTQLKNMNEQERLDLIKEFVVHEMMIILKDDLKTIAVEHEIFTSEKKLISEGSVKQAIEKLQNLGLLYKGILEAPKGKKPDDWEEREQLLFKSTEFGDDIDRPLQKSDGSYTYFASDLGYALDKINRGYQQLIYVMGADHSGYTKRLQSAIKALSEGKVESDVKICQLVNFTKDGEILKMSKRSGNFITVSDIAELVGKDVIRIMMISRKNDMVMNFDVSKVLEQSKDNPVFYIQYAHARCHSILRLAKKEFDEAYQRFLRDEVDYNLISSEEELSLIKLLAYWPKLVESSAISHEPHRILFFGMELASEFHSLWTKGKNDEYFKFINRDNLKLTVARLHLIIAIANVIASTLKICNVKPIEEM